MKLSLLEGLLALNQAFDNVIRGLERMEKVTLFDNDQLRYSRAEVETARVDANREFFDKFEEIVENDAEWAYKFCRAYDQKNKDPFDFYLEIKEREEARRKRGLPPRAVLLPDWDKDDEQPYDDKPAKKRTTNKPTEGASKRNQGSASTKSPAHTGVPRTRRRKTHPDEA